MSSFAEWLKRARAQSGLTLEQLAGKADSTHPSLSRLENGRANPSRDMVRRLAAAMGLPAAPALLAAGFVPSPEDSPEIRTITVTTSTGEQVDVRLRSEDADSLTPQDMTALQTSVETSIEIWRRTRSGSGDGGTQPPHAGQKTARG